MQINRRRFLQISGATMAFAAARSSGFAQDTTPARKRKLKKGIAISCVGAGASLEEKFKLVKEAGFDGVEVLSHQNTDELLKLRDATGLEIAHVCCATHWKLNIAGPDAEIRKQGVEGLKQALRDAKSYGVGAVLFVPGTVNRAVAYGDAWTRSQESIREALPLAEELKVAIAIENVWNNFLISPVETAHFIDSFNSPWIGCHLDLGNLMRYGWPEHWVKALAHRVKMIHVKEFSLKKMNDEGLWKGFQVQYLEGDNDWPATMKAIDEIHYAGGWLIAEPAYANPTKDLEGLKNIAGRMDKMIAM